MLAFDKPWDWIIIALIFMVLFGYKKLPDASRSLGRSLRIFKTEIKGMGEDDKARAKASEDTDAAPKALPPADVVKREADPNEDLAADVVRARPRPSPSPNGRTQTTAKAD